ncbi:MAG: putative DNA-binding transcriptional regulator YafY [Gammaproteobacteria bacterium]|jgi:predicted DNA-binding transcriptional regulator YafY
MDRTERFYKIDRLLNERRVVPIGRFLEELGVSRATFKRDLEYMRDRLHAPIEWDANVRGYRFGNPGVAPDAEHPYALPGLWFNASEIHALLTMRALLENLQPGLLGPHIEPLLARIRTVLDSAGHELGEVERRIHILPAAARSMNLTDFETICTALLSRRSLRILHYSRERDEETERTVSPQRLVHYRDNWYLDAWCHLREGLRSFAIDSIRTARPIEGAVRAVSDKALNAHLGSGYGIFSGRQTHVAKLAFSAVRARWVSNETWHPHQQGTFCADGRYELSVPFSDHRELLMDILRHGPDVEVLSPPALREAVQTALRAALSQY